jgi:hypothetical protein
MRKPHRAFMASFLAVAAACCILLPISVSQYFTVVTGGFGAKVSIESAWVVNGQMTDALAVRCEYTSPARLKTIPGNYTFIIVSNGMTLWLNGSVDAAFDRGVSDAIIASVSISSSQAANLSANPEISATYYIWVYSPARESGSTLSGTAQLTLEVI